MNKHQIIEKLGEDTYVELLRTTFDGMVSRFYGDSSEESFNKFINELHEFENNNLVTIETLVLTLSKIDSGVTEKYELKDLMNIICQLRLDAPFSIGNFLKHALSKFDSFEEIKEAQDDALGVYHITRMKILKEYLNNHLLEECNNMNKVKSKHLIIVEDRYVKSKVVEKLRLKENVESVKETSTNGEVATLTDHYFIELKDNARNYNLAVFDSSLELTIESVFTYWVEKMVDTL